MTHAESVALENLKHKNRLTLIALEHENKMLRLEMQLKIAKAGVKDE